MKQKYIKLTWNGGREINLKWKEYTMNKEYWDSQLCIKEVYWDL